MPISPLLQASDAHVQVRIIEGDGCLHLVGQETDVIDAEFGFVAFDAIVKRMDRQIRFAVGAEAIAAPLLAAEGGVDVARLFLVLAAMLVGATRRLVANLSVDDCLQKRKAALAGGDGQHAASDIPRLLDAARYHPRHIVIDPARLPR